MREPRDMVPLVRVVLKVPDSQDFLEALELGSGKVNVSFDRLGRRALE